MLSSSVRFLSLLLALAPALAAAEPSARARALLESATVIDLHADTPYQLVKRGGYDLARRNGFMQIDVPRMRAGNMAAQFFALWPPPPAVKRGRADRYCARAHAALLKAAERSGAIVPVDDVASFRRARADGKIGAFFGMEGADCLMGERAALRRWREKGLRYLGLTWNFVNPFATPASGAPAGTERGLTDEGRALVRDAFQLGVLIDVSHADEATFWDVVRHAPGPFIASHSSAASLRRHPRNLDDEQLRAIARAGGIVGVNYHRPFLVRGAATVDDVARHTAHFVRVVGAAHVALGSDFDGNIGVPRGLEDPSRLPNLVDALLRAGLTEGDIRLILGANVLRVLEDAQKPVAGPRLWPLRVEAPSPRAASRLFDRNVRTRYAMRGRTVRARFTGRPARLAVEPCEGGRGTVVLTRGGEAVARWEAELSGRGEHALPELPRGRYGLTLRGWSCLREVVVYESAPAPAAP